MALLECDPILHSAGADHWFLYIREPRPFGQAKRDRIPLVPPDMFVPDILVRIPSRILYGCASVKWKQRGWRRR